MALLFFRSIYILYILTVLTKVVLTQTRPNIEKENGNELRVRALLSVGGPGVENETGTKEVILNLPSNGNLVYEEIEGQNVEEGSRVVWDGDKTPQNARATCFLWRQSDEGIPWQPGLNFASPPIYPTGEGTLRLFPRADRLYCFDSTADKVFHEDVDSTANDGENYGLSGLDSSEKERSDNSNGTFTLLFEYRKGQQALIRLRSLPGSDTASLDFSDADAVVASTNSDIELGINVVRVALIDDPHEVSMERYIGVNGTVYERQPICALLLSQTSRWTVKVGRGVTFQPYLNVYGIQCRRAADWSINF